MRSNQDILATRLEGLRRSLQLTDRVISGKHDLTLTFSQEDSKDPARHIAGAITVFTKKVPKIASASGLVHVLGLNYHELAHVRYSIDPTTLRNKYSGMRFMEAYQILEEARVETLMCAKYGKAGKYFAYPVIEHFVNERGTWNVAFLYTHGRRYLPRNIRDTFREKFDKKYGSRNWYGKSVGPSKEFAAVIDAYRVLSFTDNASKNRAGVLINQFEKLLTKHQIPDQVLPHQDQNQPVPQPYGGGKQLQQAQEEKRREDQQKQEEAEEAKQKAEKQDEEEEKGKDGSGFGKKEEEEDEGGEDEAEDNGSGSEPDEDEGSDPQDDESESEEGESEGSGRRQDQKEDGDDAGADQPGSGSGDSDDDESGQPGNAGASGQSGAGDDGDGSDQDSEGSGAGAADGSLNASHAVGTDWELSRALEDALGTVLHDQDTQDEVGRLQDAMDSSIGLTSTLDRFPDNWYKNLKPVTPAMMAESEAIATVLRELWAKMEPGWEFGLSEGTRIDMNRAALAQDTDDYETIYVDWNEGQQDNSGLEVVILIDRSGSMVGSKIIYASQHLWELMKAIQEVDASVTALCYDHRANTLYHREDQVTVAGYVHIAHDGGTNPYDALKEAKRILSMSEKPNKLLIVCTDGEWQNEQNCGKVLEETDAVRVAIQIGHPGFRGFSCEDKFHIIGKTQGRIIEPMAKAVAELIGRNVR